MAKRRTPRVGDRQLFLLWMGISIPFVCATTPEVPGDPCPYGAIHLDEAVAHEFFEELASQSSLWWQATADQAYWQLSAFAGDAGIPHATMVMRAVPDPRGATVGLHSKWHYRYMRLQSFAPSIFPDMAREANETLLPQVEPLCRQWQMARNAKDARLEAIRRSLVAEMERSRRAAGAGDPQKKRLDLNVELPNPTFP